MFSAEEPAVFDFQQIAREKVMQWSAVCQRFLDAQRREILMGSPTPAQCEAHRTTLKGLLRMTRMLCAAVADPDYADRQMADELEGRLIQLEESWRMINNPMSKAEADALIGKFFAE